MDEAFARGDYSGGVVEESFSLEGWGLHLRAKVNRFAFRTWQRGGWWRLLAVLLIPVQVLCWIGAAIATAVVGVAAICLSVLLFAVLLTLLAAFLAVTLGPIWVLFGLVSVTIWLTLPFSALAIATLVLLVLYFSD